MLAYGARDTAANVTPFAFSNARSFSVNVSSAAIVQLGQPSSMRVDPHEVVDVELGTSLEHVDQPQFAVGTLEDVVLLDLHHRQPTPLRVDGVAQVGDLTFARQQLLAGGQPILAGRDVGITRWESWA